MAHPNHGLNDLREMFLSYFESKGHLRLPSFSLIPQNDASLLLINSGMAPMKPFFTGEVEPHAVAEFHCEYSKKKVGFGIAFDLEMNLIGLSVVTE